MRTAYIGAYGYGNLGDELCLIQAMEAFPAEESYAFSVDAEWTKRCVPALSGCFKSLEEMRAVKPERVVFGGGGIGTLPGFPMYNDWMRWAQNNGAETHIHNIGIGFFDDMSWLTPERRATLLAHKSFSVRDFKSFEAVQSWDIGIAPRVTQYPERLVAPDFSLADKVLPPKSSGRKLVGFSVINNELMEKAIVADAARIQKLVENFRGWAVVPVVSQVHRHPEGRNDGEGFQVFADRFLGGFEILFQEVLSREWWYNNLTPRTLKGVIARLDTLVSQRKHNCIHGIGAGVRTIGFHPLRDDSVPRTFVTLSNMLPPRSRLFGVRDA